MKDSISFCPYNKADYQIFKKMFEEYFLHDLKIVATEQQFDSLCREIEKQAEMEIISIDLAIIEDKIIGFVIYQIDSPKSDWYQKDGWGCIREIFISKDFRKHGYGRDLVAHAESELIALSALGLYLTSDDNKEFWQKVGYYNTGERCSANDSLVFLKTIE